MKLPTSRAAVRVSALALTAAVLAPGAAAQDGPPGLVLVEKGRVKLGTKVKDAEVLITEHEDMANALAAETPLITEQVPDFYLMPTEVTNEQYAVYVEYARIKPPYTWADEEALDTARRDFLEEQGKAAQEARARGERPVTSKFEPEAWWEKSWETTPWAVPAKLAEHPATFVDYEAAVGYARWAGLRLPTEAEWMRAARADSEKLFPWGDDWNSQDRANTVELPPAETQPVGTYSAGAVEGIYDLSGSVWEWTDSPFSPFKGYEPLSVKVGKGRQARKIEALASWDPSFRVLKGGAFPNTLLAARNATRMGAMKSQSTAALGFRCAASATPGLDVASAVLDTDVLMSSMPVGVEFNPDRVQILQRWETKAGAASERIEGYEIITGHQRALFLPVEKIDENSLKNLNAATVAEPLVFGLLHLSIPSYEPELDAGTYVVAYRAANKLPKVEEEDEEEEEKEQEPQDEPAPTTLRFTETPGFDAEADQYFLFDGEANPVIAIPAGELKFEKKGPGSATFIEWEPPKRQDPENPVKPGDTFRFTAMTDSSSSRKGFQFTLDVKFHLGDVDDSWK